MSELLPCPMCGHHAAVMYHWTGIGECSHEHCYVECENADCSLELNQDLPRDKAIIRWNTRAPAPAPGFGADMLADLRSITLIQPDFDGEDDDGERHELHQCLETAKRLARRALQAALAGEVGKK